MKRFLAAHPKLVDAVMLSIGMAVFAGLALATISSSSIWFDEGFSAYFAALPPLEIIYFTAFDVHPPLYYLALHSWTALFGGTEFGIRSLSLVFALSIILFGFLIVRHGFGRRAGYAALAVLALSPLLVRYGTEARMYTMATAVCFAATYVLLVVTQTASRRKRLVLWGLYALLVAIGMWTHYFTLFIWIAHALWLLSRAYQPKTSFIHLVKNGIGKGWIASIGLSIILFLPWLPSMLTQLGMIQVGGFWIKPVTLATIPSQLTNAVSYLPITQVTGWLAIGFVILAVLALRLGREAYPRLNASAKSSYLLLAILAFVPMILLFIASLPPLRPAYVERYILTASLFFTILIAVTLALAYVGRMKRWVIVSSSLLGVLLIIGIQQVYTLGNFNREEGTRSFVRQAVEAINRTNSGPAPILIDSPYLYFTVSAYDSPDHPVYYRFNESLKKIGSTKVLYTKTERSVKDPDAFGDEHARIWQLASDKSTAERPASANWKYLRTLTITDPTTKNQKAVMYAAEYETR